MSRLLPELLQDACITHEVLSASRGESVTFSEDALGWLKAKLSPGFTPSDVTRTLGLSIFEAHKLIRRLCNQDALAQSVSSSKRNGTEWSYAWA